MKLAVIALLAAVPAWAGNEMGNGTDHFGPEHGAAWFLGGDRVISYCIEASPEFGRGAEKVRADLAAAWAKWMAYVEVKDLYSGAEPSYRFPRKLEERRCDGREDLRLKLGVEDTAVQAVKATYQRPTAISHRESYDAQAGWGRGWIWFSAPFVIDPGFPDWARDRDFQSVLLHELGHVLGCLHVSGTIMSHTLSPDLKEGRIAPEWIGKVDHTKELLGFGFRVQRSTGFLGDAGFMNPFRAFEWLVGRKPVGEISAELRAARASLRLEVKDSQGAWSFPLVVRPGFYNPTYSSEIPVFKRVRPGAYVYSFPEGGIVLGELSHPKLGAVQAFFEASMSSAAGSIGPYSVRVVIDGVPQPLFRGYSEH
jgi:hypothetical protein